LRRKEKHNIYGDEDANDSYPLDEKDLK